MYERLIKFLLLTGLVFPAVVYAAAPERVVSLDLCTDWMLAYHAKTEQVVALSPLYRQYPAPWSNGSWPSHDGSLEQVYELRPDLVITGQYNAIQLRSRLRELGAQVAIIPLPQTLREVENYERRILSLLGLSVGSVVAMQAETHPAATAPRLLLLGANGIGTGKDTFEHQIIEQAGWRNYLQESGYVQLDLEQIAVDPPDAILWSAPAAPALANRYAEHPVLKRLLSRQHRFNIDYWRWQCPGPWTRELIDQLQRWKD